MTGSPLVDGIDLVTIGVTLDGKAAPGDYEIVEVETVQEINRIPHARIVLLDGSVADETFKNSEASNVAPGTKVEIAVGYHGTNAKIFAGLITRVAVKVGRDCRTTLVLSCSDAALKMTGARRSAVYHAKSDSAVMQTMIEAHGLTADVEATSDEHPQMVQYNCSDWDYLLKRAEACGRLVIVGAGTVTVKSPTFSASGLVVTYGESVHHADLELDACRQPQSTPVSGWSPSTQSVLSATGSEPTLNRQSDVNGAQLAAVLGYSDARPSLAGLDQAALRSWSEARLLHARLSRISGAVAFSGSAAAKAGTCIKLRGFGARFNGDGFVTRVTHTVKAGLWRTEAGLGLPPSTALSARPMEGPAAAGLLPFAWGLQIGKVKQVHEDPDGQFRIKISLPLVANAEEGIWARLAAPYAGVSMGLQCLPEVEDEVVVGYFDADPTAPVVLGSLHSSTRALPFTPDAKNTIKALVTASALKLTFDDVKKIAALETPGGHKLTMSDEAASITLVDSTGNRVAMEKSGVTVESKMDLKLQANGSIAISGKQGVTITTPMDASVKGMNVHLSADVKLAAEGQVSAQLTSSAETVVKGALVMIN